MEIRQLIKDSGKKMELVTSNLCAVAANLGEKSNEEIMSPDVVVAKSLGGPSKIMRQSMKKKFFDAPNSAI